MHSVQFLGLVQRTHTRRTNALDRFKTFEQRPVEFDFAFAFTVRAGSEDFH
jgi:hypothetical protein